MTSVDKAGEPSMEEALASVRQLIADVPVKDVPEKPVSVFPALEPNPLVPQAFGPDADAAGRAGTPEAAPPAPDRLSGVLKSGALPATRPFGSKRPMPFDQDLADMLDETAGDSAPKPSVRADEPTTAAAAPAPKTPAAPEPPAARASSPFPSPSLSASAPFSIGAAPTAAAPPPPTRTFGFPPLRKSSFYPPQAAVTPTLPPLPAVEAAPTPAASEPAAPKAPAAPTTKAAEPGGNLDEALKRLSNLGAVVPGAPVVAPKPSAPTMLSLGTPQVAESLFNGSSVGAGRDTPRPAPAAADPKIDDKALWRPVAREEAKDPVTPARERDAATPDAATKPAMFASAAAPLPKTARETDPSTVAAQALDALAQGLAASGMPAAVAPKAAPALAEPTRARPEAATPDPAPTLTASDTPPAAAAPASARTLEDVVADMLRPMLQQWVSDNMPRIMERALRVELAKSLPPGQKPPGA